MSKRIVGGVFLSMAIVLIGSERAKAAEYGELVQKGDKWVFTSTEEPVFKYMRDTGWITEERYVAVSSQTGKNWIEPADAVLNRRKDIDWNRYLKTGLHLPEWLDLGLEQRSRIESYDHPWRVVQVPGNGAPDTQVPLRSRVRFGLGGNGPARFLFEGNDSRSFILSDPLGAFSDTTMVNTFDILQLFGALKLDNVLGTGLRTDLHFGRMTLDVGNRRMIARNDFRNTSNSFDGVHWLIGQEQLWQVRAFLVEPVIRLTEQMDHQNSNSLFWGTYFEGHHFPWFQMDAYYLGLNDQRLPNVTTHRTYSTFGGRLYKTPKREKWIMKLRPPGSSVNEA